MQEKRILITGSTGFLGRALQDRLAKNSSSSHQKVYTLSRTEDPEKALQEISAIKPHQVYHLAGISRVGKDLSFPDYFLANTVQFQNLLESLEKMGEPVKVALASSIHLYGQQTEVTEQSSVHPQSPYAYSKYLAEEALKSFCKKSPLFQGFSVRLASCIGAQQREGFVTIDLAKKIKNAIQSQADSLRVGSLASFRQFLDVDDAAKAFIALMEYSQTVPFEAVNLAGSKSLTIEALLDQFFQLSQKPFKIESEEEHHNSFTGVKVLPGKFQELFPDFSFRPIETTLKEIWENH